MENILDKPTGLRSNGSAIKEDFINRMKAEIKDAKQRKQTRLWAYWHFNHKYIMFIDTPTEYKLNYALYENQGYMFDKELSTYDLSHIAKQVGAKSVKRKIFINRDLKVPTLPNSKSIIYTPKVDDLSMDPVSLFLGDRVNAFNEFVIIEFQVLDPK